MEKSRSLIRQVIGHKMLFVVFLLFSTDILLEVVAIGNMTNHVNTTASLSTSSFPASFNATAEISTTSVISLINATMPHTLGKHLSSTGQPAHSLNAAPPVSKQEVQSATAVSTDVPENTSSPGKARAPTQEKHPLTESEEVQESKPSPVQKEVPSKTTVTPPFDNETVSSPAKDLGTRSQGSFSEQSPSAIAYPEITKSTETKDDRKGRRQPGQAVTELTRTPETGSRYTSGTSTTSVTPITDDDASNASDKSPSRKNSSVIILVVVFSILLLVGLLVFLYFRRRRHSGSTSFNSPEWAGQATLPDDTGLEKDMEQQVGSAGEGETRRGTLVTFFGKRQSRVPSIAMEDVNGKGGKEETEQLLCGEAEIGSPSEGVGDANGKVPEPLRESSQESPASNKLGEK